VTDDGDAAMAEDAVATGAARRERLAQRRKALGLTQRGLADLLGVERSTVVRWEHGETEPLPWIRPRLARALRVSVDQLGELLASASSGVSADQDTAREPAGPASGGDEVPAVPRQLPATVADFTGRAAEIETLTRILDDAAGGAPGTVVISAIGGTAGVGKTALALHWAHQVAGRFGDGHLYVNLRGFDPSGTPTSSAEAVRGFLDALGVPPGKVPLLPEAQTGMYRSLVADRKMLIVLDNARDERQVRPLLPASPASLVLVTSRNQLAGLASAEGARLVILDVLTEAEAVELLTARLGHARATAEPAAIAEIASLCACLPLALAVAAARAAARPGLPLAALAAELRDSSGRLDALDAGDPSASVRAVFSWSYSQLSAEAARLFRLLGLHPGPDISVPAAASLAAISQADGRPALGELTRDCLITEHVPGRYAFHDLLRGYAADQARAYESVAGCDAAVGRVLDHYLHSASHAATLLHPFGEPVTLLPPRPGTAPERPAGHQQALAWFDAEHQVLLAAVTLAAESGFDTHAWQLPCAIGPYLRARGHYQQWAAAQNTAMAAAARLGDIHGQAISERMLARALTNLDDYDQASSHFEHCLRLYRRLGDQPGEARTHHNLGYLAERQHRYADALRHTEMAFRLFEAIGDKAEQAMTLNDIGWFHGLLGDYEQARDVCRRVLSLSAEIGYRRMEGTSWDSLGYAEHHLGNFGEAAACYERALSIFRELGELRYEADALTSLGDTYLAAGELPLARETWQRAVPILEDLGHPGAEKVRAKLASLDGGPDLAEHRHRDP
jgi:tetratricopeptide (TPR) repeat protein/transcriptional regulator with XRE-family HTH domain